MEATRLSPEKRKKKKKPIGAAASPNLSPELRRSSERPSARALAAESLRPPIAAAAARSQCSSQPDRSPTGLAFSSAPSRDAFNVQLRAERAEALVVQLRAQLHGRTVEAFLFSQEVKLADDLTAVCEATQLEQHAALHELTLELTTLRATCSEQRESVMHSSRLIKDLEIVVKSSEAALVAERAAAAIAKAKYREQGDVWRAGAERIRQDRQTDAAKKLERFRVWEDTISQWLEDGRNKKLEDIVYTQNIDVYERLGESLREELQVLKVQQRTWDDTHAAACRAEVTVLEQQLGKTRGALEPLQQARANLEKQTEEVLHAFFVGEMAEVRTQNKALTQQLGMERAKAKTGGERNAEAALRYRARAKEGLGQLTAGLRAVEAEMSELVKLREQLAVSDPGVLLDQERARRSRLEELVVEERAARETADLRTASESRKKQEVQAKLMRKEEEIAARRLEFGEKAHLRMEVDGLRASAGEHEAELGGARQQHALVLEQEAQSKEGLGAQLAQSRAEAKKMALSLAQYATLEAEWMSEREAGQAALDKFKAELRPLRKRARKADELEVLLEASSHGALEAERTTSRGLRKTAAALEGQLQEQRASWEAQAKRVAAELEASRRHARDLESAAHSAQWSLQEALDEQEARLRAQAAQLKEGLAWRVARQSGRGSQMRCLKAWAVYVLRRKLRRQGAAPGEALSDDEGGAGVGEPAGLLGIVHSFGGMF